MAGDTAGTGGTSSVPAPAPATVVLDEGKRLSESLLWSLQRGFYSSSGPQAWKPKGVPFYISSNPFIAKTYARVFLGVLRDLAAAGFDAQAPVYVVELAAGSGQFSYLFLKSLLEMKAALPALRSMTLRYVMTDFAASDLRAWQENERLKGLADSGVLDFGIFDLERDGTVQLVRSGETLTKGTVSNPLLAIANYAFDSTVQDAFFIKAGELHEAAATLLSSQTEKDVRDPAVLERASLRFEPRPIRGDYYDDPALNRVLEQYRARLGDTLFLVPIGALRCIRALREWTGGRLFLICGDKAMAHEEDLRGRGDAGLTFHGGCVSMTVNLHALGQYFRELGGWFLHSPQRDNRLRVSILASGVTELPEARLAFEDAMNGLHPCAYNLFLHDLRENYKEPPLDAILALLRMSEWDHEVLGHWREPLKKHLASATGAARAEALVALRRVWDNCYPMLRDLALELARICIGMKEPREALRYAEESLRLHGDHHLTWLAIGLAQTLLGEYAEALRAIDRGLALDPGNVHARELKVRLEAQLERA